MPRASADVRLTNRTRRGDLPPSRKPYFRQIAEGLHLGYRRPATPGRPGAWVGRRRRADGGYKTENLGFADDLPGVVPGQQPNGTTVLTYDQAQTALRNWAKAEAEAERIAKEGAGGVPTVQSVVEAYFKDRESRGEAGADARYRLTRHVLNAPLASIKLSGLTERHLVEWRAALVRAGRRKGAALQSPLSNSTISRLLNDLRAALNGAAERYRLDLAFVIRAGLKAPPNADKARDPQILNNSETGRLITAAQMVDPDFGLLVMMLAVTGARFSQLARASVSGFQPENQRLMVPPSRKGRGLKNKPAQPLPLPADAVAALQLAVAGRPGAEPLLMRWNNEKVSPTKESGFKTWRRNGRRPWKDSSELTRPWGEALKIANLPMNLIPYALRHSSIVRALTAGVPVRIVAAAHDTSIAMIERHYSAYIVEASGEIMRRAIVPFTAAENALTTAEGAS